jgi:polar amino acid transport system substrate-binding protein
MYAAKELGKGGYKFFHEDMFQKVAKRTELEADLRKALEKQEFTLYYQPYFNITDGRIVGMEALIRWFHNKKGYIPPSDFIPVAEETGLIKEIGQWVLEEACHQSKRWEHQGLRNLPIAVNVSKIQLEDRRFVTDLTRLLGDLELDPRFLQLEITESCIMKSMEHSIEKLDAIKHMGIRISLDDFGTGYSSLNYLQTLPIDIVKIDRSFVNEISRRPHNTLIINDIISIAHKSQMSVIAEGVETEDQLSYLRQENCDAMQGFYRCRPLPGKEVEQWLIR